MTPAPKLHVMTRGFSVVDVLEKVTKRMAVAYSSSVALPVSRSTPEAGSHAVARLLAGYDSIRMSLPRW